MEVLYFFLYLICLRRLIQFGLKTKIIRRLQGYPLKLPSATESHHKLQSVAKWLNGIHSYDEICCKSGKISIFHLVLGVDNKYLSWVYGVDRKVCHEGH